MPLNNRHKSLHGFHGVHNWLHRPLSTSSMGLQILIYTKLHQNKLWCSQTQLPCFLVICWKFSIVKVIEDRSHPIIWGLDEKYLHFVSAWFCLYFNINPFGLIKFAWWCQPHQLISLDILHSWDLQKIYFTEMFNQVVDHLQVTLHYFPNGFILSIHLSHH